MDEWEVLNMLVEKLGREAKHFKSKYVHNKKFLLDSIEKSLMNKT